MGGAASDQMGASRKKTGGLASPRCKRPARPNAPADASSTKIRRKLQRTSNMQPVFTQVELAAVDEAIDDDLAGEVGGGGVARVARFIVEEVEEEEE